MSRPKTADLQREIESLKSALATRDGMIGELLQERDDARAANGADESNFERKLHRRIVMLINKIQLLRAAPALLAVPLKPSNFQKWLAECALNLFGHMQGEEGPGNNVGWTCGWKHPNDPAKDIGPFEFTITRVGRISVGEQRDLLKVENERLLAAIERVKSLRDAWHQSDIQAWNLCADELGTVIRIAEGKPDA